AVEAAEAWAIALERKGPSALALSRQATPGLRDDAKDNRTARGLYELLPAEGGAAKVSLFATGTEVALAVEARAQLQKEGVPTRVVSAPCLELFRDQDEDYVHATIGDAEVRIVVEAGVAQGWSDVIDNCAFVGMSSFGASAPAKALYQHFGITTDAIVEAAQALL
ncbi:MAG: transketolase C-terminal domain-containing protein, partial [Alphaproteobacteria bacterium]|nr:transketolase C-terminal domain-containing protein [Alphaproteobacteria bacterium]